MNKISREECYQTALVNLWNHIDALQKELDRLERMASERKAMTVEEIRKVIDPIVDSDYGWNNQSLAEAIQPLTVQQGFVPDWSKAGDDATGFVMLFTSVPKEAWTHATYIPRPAPKTRERTNTEMAKALCDKLPDQEWVHPVFWQASNDKLKEACLAAGISLTVTEE